MEVGFNTVHGNVSLRLLESVLGQFSKSGVVSVCDGEVVRVYTRTVSPEEFEGSPQFVARVNDGCRCKSDQHTIFSHRNRVVQTLQRRHPLRIGAFGVDQIVKLVDTNKRIIKGVVVR